MQTKHDHPGIMVADTGVSFCVWAPFAEAVWLLGDFNNWAEPGISLQKDSDGYWHASVANVQPGQEYKYNVKNGSFWRKRNDPRALQLTASGENSVIVGLDFDWQDDNFTMPAPSEQVIYELHIGTFNRTDPATPGTFASAANKLDYLADLGITAIELMPCSETSIDRWWGYTPDFIYAIEAAYGGRYAFMQFVREAHIRGIGVILDVVYNHICPDPVPDLWQFDGWSEQNGGGVYFYNDWRAKTPWGPTRLDYGRPEVRQYVVDNAVMWLRDCHIDGLRVDSTHYIRNAEGRDNFPPTDIPEGWQLLQEVCNAAKQARPHTLLIAEDTASNPWITKPTNEKGAGFDAQWETPLPYVLRDAVLEPLNDSDRNLGSLIEALQKQYNGDFFQKVIYSESHDADANGRSRLDEEIQPGQANGLFARRRSILAAIVILTSPGIPMLFQGQEFMEDGYFSHWQELDWSKAESFHGTLQAYKDLIALRRNQTGRTPGLLGGDFQLLHADHNNKILAYKRDETIVVCNFANQQQLTYEIPLPDGRWETIFSSDWRGYSDDFSNIPTPPITAENNKGRIAIGPYSGIILVPA